MGLPTSRGCWFPTRTRYYRRNNHAIRTPDWHWYRHRWVRKRTRPWRRPRRWARRPTAKPEGGGALRYHRVLGIRGHRGLAIPDGHYTEGRLYRHHSQRGRP